MRYELISVLEHPPFPNNPRPVVYYPGVFEPAPDLTDRMAQLFEENGWPGAWVNGVYPFHHFHAQAHEVLGCARGWVTVRLGGPGGSSYTLRAGDAVLLPAGVGHQRVDASGDYLIVGSYPKGQSPDMERGDPDRFDQARSSVQRVPLPNKDPVYGAGGPAVDKW